MLTIRDRRSGELFDPWERLGRQRYRLLKRSWAGVFRDYLLKHLPVRELASHFRDDFGRPSKDLFVALGALILQQLHDLTDQQTIEAVSFNIAWHYALDIRDEGDAYLCERTLRNYRRKVIDDGLDEMLFRTLTDRLIGDVGVETKKQRLDSTAVRSAIRSLTRLGILVETASKFLRELKRRHPELYGQVEQKLLEKYLDRRSERGFFNTTPSESRRRLPEAARDLYELLQQFRRTEASNLEGFLLLERVFGEQCELSAQDGEPVMVRVPQDVSCDSVVNPADPDASYNARHGAGYIVQLMETFAEDDHSEESKPRPEKPDLITHVAVGKMTVHDRSALDPALDDVKDRDVKPAVLLADSHYGSNECLRKGQAREVEIVSPSMPAKGKRQGKLTLEDFELDDEGRIIRCPEGHKPIETRAANCRLQATFDRSRCEFCEQRRRCPASSVGRSTPRYQYTRDRVRQRARRLEDATIAFREQYRWRAGIEATICRFKHQLGMAHLLVRGMNKIRYAAFLRALGLNIRRVAVYHAEATGNW